MRLLRCAGRKFARGCFVGAVACGPKPVANWSDYDVPTQAHYSGHHSSQIRSDAVASDPSRYTLAQIEMLPFSVARAALERLSDRAPAARIALRAARLAHHAGDDAEARALVARAAMAADESEVHSELVALQAELAAPAVDDTKVAVLLPLTGRFAAVGAELRAAIELAPAHGTTWAFLDTRGEPAGAAAAVEQAIEKGAVAALGPVGARELAAAVRAAAPRRLPIAALAPDDGADAGAGVFRAVNSAGDEARAVAALARSDNFSNVAVFAPRDDVGQDTAEAFATEAQRLGLNLVASGTYDPTGGGVERDVKRFLNLVPATNPRLADHLRIHGDKGWRTFSPDIPFSLLYIPDRYDRAAVVAAFLPYFGVELHTTEFTDPSALRRKHGGRVPQVVQLVGGSGWNHPSLPIRGGDAVQGAWIVDVFAGGIGDEVSARFAAEYQRKTTRIPSTAAAQAHDAAALVATARAAMSTKRGDPRELFRASLARAKLDDGVCGPAAMASDGEVVRSVTVLEVQADELRIAD